MTRLLVLRPDPGAAATMARAKAMGLDAVAMPLFSIRPVAWTLPADLPADLADAIVMTSANAARLGGAGLAALAHLPLFAVGAETAAAARAAGFAVAYVGIEDGPAALAAAIAAGHRAPLHLAGRDHRPLGCPVLVVYEAEAADTLPGPVAPGSIALVHSPRAAALFAALVDAAELARGGIGLAAISPAAAAAAGTGWRAVVSAAEPNDAALLAVAASLCERQ
jgi:uroporphyrinogen-III synthase